MLKETSLNLPFPFVSHSVSLLLLQQNYLKDLSVLTVYHVLSSYCLYAISVRLIHTTPK